MNLSGAFALGIFSGAALSGTAYTIVFGGGLGDYTTFSTWMLESHRAGEDGDAEWRRERFNLFVSSGGLIR